MESLYVWHYTLRSRQGLNAASAKTCHEGVLIRLEEGGVGCVHPWPELGDAALPDQLLALSGRRAQTRLTSNSASALPGPHFIFAMRNPSSRAFSASSPAKTSQ